LLPQQYVRPPTATAQVCCSPAEILVKPSTSRPSGGVNEAPPAATATLTWPGVAAVKSALYAVSAAGFVGPKAPTTDPAGMEIVATRAAVALLPASRSRTVTVARPPADEGGPTPTSND
jgi:hypothetical protein